MFEGKQFYHRSTENAVAAFGTLFNSIEIERNGKRLKVPLSYSPTEHFLETLRKKDTETGERINKLLPRMSFTFSKPTYDNTREGDLTKKIKSIDNGVKWQFSPVPYNYTVELNIWTKYLEDNYQIMEQILPYFRPDFNVSINETLENTEDISFILEDVDTNDSYESSFLDKRLIVTTMTFTAKMYFYPPVNEGKLIREAIINFSPNLNSKIVYEECVATLNPFMADPDDEFSIIETSRLILNE